MRCQSQLSGEILHIFVSEHNEQIIRIEVTWHEPDDQKSSVFPQSQIEHDDEANEDHVVIPNWQGEQAAQVLAVVVMFGETQVNFDTDVYPTDIRQDLTQEGGSSAQGNLRCQPGDSECTLQIPTQGAL